MPKLVLDGKLFVPPTAKRAQGGKLPIVIVVPGRIIAPAGLIGPIPAVELGILVATCCAPRFAVSRFRG
jgi:hypothetical protein